MTELPAPLVPASADLRNYPFTPMYRSRLFGSSFHARVSDSGWRAGVTLWLKSWDQMPAGSLPDDDIDLCRLAELGRDMKTWLKLKVEALWGWFKCSDGRLYHTVVAEGVIEAWEGKLEQRDRTEKARAAKRAKRLSQSEEASVTEKNPSVTDALNHANASVTDSVTGSNRKGKGKGKGEGKGDNSEPNGSGASAATNGFAGKPEWWPKQDRYGRIVSDLSDKIVFDVGKAVLGKSSGGQIKKLIQLYHDYRDVTDLLLQAEAKSNPGEWIAAVIRNRERDCFDELPALSREKYPEHAY